MQSNFNKKHFKFTNMKISLHVRGEYTFLLFVSKRIYKIRNIYKNVFQENYSDCSWENILHNMCPELLWVQTHPTTGIEIVLSNNKSWEFHITQIKSRCFKVFTGVLSQKRKGNAREKGSIEQYTVAFSSYLISLFTDGVTGSYRIQINIFNVKMKIKMWKTLIHIFRLMTKIIPIK